MKNKIVVIGGGHGQATILKGLKEIDNIELTTIVTVADDGGSTGRLRDLFSMPAMGDIRNVMVALSSSTTLMADIMEYRFSEYLPTDIQGHNLGNLILTALTQHFGDFMTAISSLSEVLNVKGKIIPSTTEIVTLIAEMVDGTIVKGESNIPKSHNVGIKRVYYEDDVKATPEAVLAIMEADYILIGIGSLYTSVLPNLIIDEIRNAFSKTTAKKIYLCNIMSQYGETTGYSVEDHVEALHAHLNCEIDEVLCASNNIPENILSRYREEKAELVTLNETSHSYIVRNVDLLTSFDRGLIRHDSTKIRDVILKEIKGKR